ncbi:GNAT family N-acetyltransferase [Nisaea sp.]|uniref:GNAT family N-acetyltransferase n=1 Tax=Nisaea sp. TaxID=2024842 RepID=UPI003263F783
MLYRTLTPDDFNDALALYRELSGTQPVADGDFGRDRFKELLNRDGTAIYGAETNGRIVSMATLHLMPNMTYGGRPYALVENVVTLKTRQGEGIGRGVMTALIDAAWAADAYKVMLLTGRRAEARGFYEKLGFDGDEKHGMILRKA